MNTENMTEEELIAKFKANIGGSKTNTSPSDTRYRYPYVELEEVIKNPTEYIIPQCLPACKSLWGKNIETFMVSNNDDDDLYVLLTNVSPENMAVFQEVQKQDPRYLFDSYRDTIGIAVKGHDDRAMSELDALTDIFVVQDTLRFKSSEDFLESYKYTGGEMVVEADGTIRREKNPELANITLQEALKKSGKESLYVAGEGRIYDSPMYLKWHQRYQLSLQGKKIMKGILILSPNDETEMFDYNIRCGYNSFDYELSINTDLSKDYLSLISTTGDLEDSIDTSLEITDNPNMIEFYNLCKGKMSDLLKDSEYICFNFGINDIADYIKRNPILKTKKILFSDFYELDSEIIKEIENAFGNETSNLYFDVDGNDKFIGFKEYNDTIKAINDMAQEIERFNLSPLEKIMYAYDLVRNKVYVEVDENEDKLNSRTLSSALLGDKIVCVGYARIFKTLLEKLGIHSREMYLYYPDRSGGHARNEIYIKDEKYGVDGVYYFDPTWDSKKSEDDTSYLLSYRFFCMTKTAMDSLDKGRYTDDEFPYFSPELMWEFEEMVDSKGFEKLSPEMIKSINYMSLLVYDKLLINKIFLLPIAPPSLRPDKDKIMDELIPLVEHFNSPLSADLMLKVLFNVRKKQYYYNPQKYQMNMNDFFQIVLRSDWVFDDDILSGSMLDELSSQQRAKVKAHQLKKYSDENDLERSIEQVKLANVLQNTLSKRSK